MSLLSCSLPDGSVQWFGKKLNIFQRIAWHIFHAIILDLFSHTALKTAILFLLAQERAQSYTGGRENKMMALPISGEPFSSRLCLLHPFLCLYLWLSTAVFLIPLTFFFLLFRQIDLAFLYEHLYLLPWCIVNSFLFLFFIYKCVF